MLCDYVLLAHMICCLKITADVVGVLLSVLPCGMSALQGLRSKTRTLVNYPSSPDQLPVWNFDGSSTGQAVGHDSDVYMKPVAVYPDPMLPEGNCLVLCETQDKDGKPHVTNNRNSCDQVNRGNPFLGD